MTQTVNIRITEGEVTTTEKRSITPINLYQFTQTLAIVNNILKSFKDDDSLAELFTGLLSSNDEDGNPDAEEIIKSADSKFIASAVNSFQLVAVRLPDQAINLVSVLSGIEKEILEKQDLFDVMDIYDAVIGVNDIERLIERVKKSMGATTKAMGFLNLKRLATAKQN